LCFLLQQHFSPTPRKKQDFFQSKICSKARFTLEWMPCS
jgi:hypothetical protein